MKNERSFSSGHTSPAKSRLTFTRPPNTTRARHHPRENMTHLPDKLREIERENLILVQHIADIGSKGTSFAAQQNPYFQQSGGPSTKSSAAINRKKQAEKVAQENLALLRRLQNIKPSLSVAKMEHDHAKNQQYVRNLQKTKQRTGGVPATTGQLPEEAQ